MADEIIIGQLDPNRNLSASIINCFIQAIHEYDLNGRATAATAGISDGLAFQSFCKPIIEGFNEYIKKYEFDPNAIATTATTKSGRDASSAYATFCKNSGLLDVSGTNFCLSELAQKIYNGDISCEEYAFLLLSKQGIFVNNAYKGPVIEIFASIFEKQDTICKTDIENEVISKYSTSGATIKCRYDILLNTLHATGLVKKNWKSQCEINPQARFLFSYILDNASKLSPTPIKKEDYYAYVGKVSTGFYEIMDESISSKYHDLFHGNIESCHYFNISLECYQQIFFGAPGSGKSFELNRITKGHDVIRTTFHPDSDYSTFVGAYKPVEVEIPKTLTVWDSTRNQALEHPVVDMAGNPVSEKKITYRFIQQAFLKAYVNAWKKYSYPVGKKACASKGVTFTVAGATYTILSADSTCIMQKRVFELPMSSVQSTWNDMWKTGSFVMPTGVRSGRSVQEAICNSIFSDNPSITQGDFSKGWNNLLSKITTGTGLTVTSGGGYTQYEVFAITGVNDKISVSAVAKNKKLQIQRCFDGTTTPAGVEIGIVDILKKRNPSDFEDAWQQLAAELNGAPSSLCASASPSIMHVDSGAKSPYSGCSLGTNEPFLFSKENGMDLTDEEQELLATIDAFHFLTPGTQRFGDVHKEIEVTISDRRNYEGLLQPLHYSKEELKKRSKEIRALLDNGDMEQDPDLQEELANIHNILEVGRPSDDNPDDLIIDRKSSPLLGLYAPAEKKVYLFKQNIEDAAGNNSSKYFLLLASTYIHEMFHAFYSKEFHIPAIEEAVVEASTLCFLEQLARFSINNLPADPDKKYYYEVKNKFPYFPEYSFGAFLYEHRSANWIELFKKASGIDQADALVSLYDGNVSQWGYLARSQKIELKDILYTILVNQVSKGTSVHIGKDAQILVIEEINRGDCAQVFGDVFQLLDRNDYGFSSYPVEPDSDIQRELKTALSTISIPSEIDQMFLDDNGLPCRYSWTDEAGMELSCTTSEAVKEGHIMVLPSNLLIFATMNTSDQSLFPMDSAFKRRWEWKYFAIKNEGKNFRITADGTTYDWWEIISELNRRILSITNSADKQIGYWFAKLPDGETEISIKTFVSKVVFYLWNDVFKDYAAGGDNPFGEGSRFEDFYDEKGEPDIKTVKRFLDNLSVRADNATE